MREILLNEVHELAKEILECQKRDFNWPKVARPEQLPPRKWNTWLLLAGRGFGKTRTGAETIRQLVSDGYRHICLLGETMQDVRRVMIEGKSGILSVHPPFAAPRYYPSRNMVLWPNGARAYGFSSEVPDALRGPQFDAAWVDEIAKFHDPDGCWDQLMMTLRIGDPKLIITTTPRPIKIIKKLVEDRSVHVTRGTTFDNAANLSPYFMNAILQYDGTEFGQQELYADIISEGNEALWKVDDIRHAECIPEMDEIVVAVDPAVTHSNGSDETGIVVVGKHRNVFYVIEDASMKADVLDWATKAVAMYYKYNARAVAVEVNQGGNLAKQLMLQIDPNIVVSELRASQSKYIRAQPIAMMYRRGLVFHAQPLRILEEQLVNFHLLQHSPDRVDALVWGIYFLNKPRNLVGIL